MTTCPCAYVAPTGVEPWTAAWHIGHRSHHVAKFPACGDATRASLDLFVRLAESDRMRPPRVRGVGGCL